MAFLRGMGGEVGLTTRGDEVVARAGGPHEPRPAGADAPATGPSAPVDPPLPSRPARAAKEAAMSHPMKPEDETPVRLRWARLRFSIIGPLLASPPEPGELAGRISEL